MVDAGGCWELGLTSNPDGTGLDSVELTINNRDEATASFVLGLIKEEFSLYRTGSNTFRYELKAKYIMDYIHELNRIHKKKESDFQRLEKSISSLQRRVETLSYGSTAKPKERCAVYIFNKDNGKLLKIGISNNPKRRKRELENSNGQLLRPVKVCWFSSREIALTVESNAHKRFRRYRTYGEWFSGIDENHVVNYLDDQSKKYGSMVDLAGSRVHWWVTIPVMLFIIWLFMLS